MAVATSIAERFETEIKRSLEVGLIHWRAHLDLQSKSGQRVVGDNLKLIYDAVNRAQDNPRPTEGEFIEIDDKYYRIASIWDLDGFPVVKIQFESSGSYYLNEDGSCSMSGSLDTTVVVRLLREGQAIGHRMARVWMFESRQWEAHNGVYFNAPMRVFEGEYYAG